MSSSVVGHSFLLHCHERANVTKGFRWLAFTGWAGNFLTWLWQGWHPNLPLFRSDFTRSPLASLLVRVWALYDCSRRLLVFLLIEFCCEIIAMSTIMGLQLPLLVGA